MSRLERRTEFITFKSVSVKIIPHICALLNYEHRIFIETIELISVASSFREIDNDIKISSIFTHHDPSILNLRIVCRLLFFSFNRHVYKLSCYLDRRRSVLPLFTWALLHAVFTTLFCSVLRWVIPFSLSSISIRLYACLINTFVIRSVLFFFVYPFSTLM